MLLTIILAIIGIIASVIVTRYYTRKQMAMNQISHYAIKSFEIGKGLRELFPDFQMLYHGKSLAKYIRVCQGSFKNTGNRDIHNYRDVGFTLIFPEEYIIKAIKVNPSTDDLSIKNQIDEKNPNKVHFYISELIRMGEAFKYTILLESSEYMKNPFGNLRFSNRIPNTSILEADVKHIMFYKRISTICFWITLLLIVVAILLWKKHLLSDDVVLYVFIISAIIFAALSVVAHIKSIITSATLNFLKD